MTDSVVTAGELDRENPWPGLHAFGEDAQAFFYGRSLETSSLLRHVLDFPVTLLYGRSGLGKTSLLQAALFPALRAEHLLPIPVRFDLEPGAPPVTAQVLERVRNAVLEHSPDSVLPAEGASLWAYLHRADLKLWSSRNYRLTPVVVFDQFEEVFTLGDRVPELVETFRNDLGDLAENRIPAYLAASGNGADGPSADLVVRAQNYKLLLCLREDFLPELESWRPLIPSLGASRLRLLPMQRRAALEAVVGPAPHLITRVLASRVVDFIAGENPAGVDGDGAGNGRRADRDDGRLSVEPALLSLFCRELNEKRKRRGTKVLDVELIDGAKRDILPNYYERCVRDLPPRVSRFIEAELITQNGFRDGCALDDAVPGQVTNDELAQLVRSRLVRLDDRYGTKRIELTHDVLTAVVREKRDEWQIEREKEEVAAAHRQQQRKLEEAAARREADLYHQREIERARRLESEVEAGRRFRRLSIALAALLVVAVLSTVTAVFYWRKASEKGDLAWSSAFANEAESRAETQPDEAILLGLESMSLSTASGRPPPAGLTKALSKVPYPSRQLLGHTRQVRGIAFSPGMRFLATASADGTVRLWDVASGQPQDAPLTGHTDAVTGVSFSPDGQSLATASADGTVRLWDVASGRPRGAPLVGHAGSVNGVAFSPDGRLLASAGSDRSVRLWDVASGRPHGAPLAGHSDAVNAVAFSPDGRLLASASSDRSVRLWDMASGQPHGAPLARHSDVVNTVAFSPGGSQVASGSADGTVRLWDVVSGQQHGTPFTGKTTAVNGVALAVNGVAFSPDGNRIASGNSDGTVRLWDAATGKQDGQPLVGHTGAVYAVAFSPDGTDVASCANDSTARIWTIHTPPSQDRHFVGDAAQINALSFSPDGSVLATASEDHTARVWDAETGQSRGPTLEHSGAVYDVEFSPDGSLLATADDDHDVRLWDWRTGRLHGPVLVGHTDAVSEIAFSPDGTVLASVGVDRTLRLWDTSTGQPIGAPHQGHTDVIVAVAFNRAGTLIATGSADQTVRLWDAATGQPHGGPLIGHTNSVNDVEFSPDGTLLASTSSDQSVRLWDVATGLPHGGPLLGHRDRVVGVAFSPDGALLASASFDETVRLWDTATGQPHGDPLGFSGGAISVKISSKGLLTGAGVDGIVRLWSLARGLDLNRQSDLMRLGCSLVNRNLSIDEWNQVARDLPYARTCPDIPAGPNAPADAPPAAYLD